MLCAIVPPQRHTHRWRTRFVSAYYYIVPYLPPDWDESGSTLQLNVADFRAQLERHWGMAIVFTHHSTMPDLEWHFVLRDGAPSLDWYLYHHHQVIRCRHDDFIADFAHWYRSYVPGTHRLFLLSAGSGYALELTNTTSDEDIWRFFR